MKKDVNIGDAELLIDFKTAKDKREQINILGDLHCCAPRAIAERLHSLGALDGTGLAPSQFSNKYAPVPSAPARPRAGRGLSFDENLARRMWDDGVSSHDMAARLGISHCAVLAWAKRRGLKRERPKSGRKRKENLDMKEKTEEQMAEEILETVDAGSRKTVSVAEADPRELSLKDTPETAFTLGMLRCYLSEFLPAALNRAQLRIDGAPVIEFFGFSVTQPNGVPTVDLLTRRA